VELWEEHERQCDSVTLSLVQSRAVFLQIQGMDFKWLEPETSAPISVQPINRIRVWGIGLENER